MSRPFLPGYVAPKKGAGDSNPVKNRVLESFSKIFFTLASNIFCIGVRKKRLKDFSFFDDSHVKLKNFEKMHFL